MERLQPPQTVFPPRPGQSPAMPPQQVHVPRATRWALVAVIIVHTVVACAQPVLAGAYFEGDVDAIGTHGLNGSLLPLLSMIQFGAAVLFWRPGRGPGWPAVATVGLFLAEGIQIGMGYSRSLAIHIPLGVAIVASLLALSIWAVTWRPGRTRRPARAGTVAAGVRR
jgi:hypothetical protein